MYNTVNTVLAEGKYLVIANSYLRKIFIFYIFWSSTLNIWDTNKYFWNIGWLTFFLLLPSSQLCLGHVTLEMHGGVLISIKALKNVPCQRKGPEP